MTEYKDFLRLVEHDSNSSDRILSLLGVTNLQGFRRRHLSFRPWLLIATTIAKAVGSEIDHEVRQITFLIMIIRFMIG